MHQPSAGGFFRLYPHTTVETGSVAILEVLDPNCPQTTMGGLTNGEMPISFASRYLTATEGKSSPIIALAAVVNWVLQRCKRFLCFVTHVEIIVPTVEYLTIICMGMEHLRL